MNTRDYYHGDITDDGLIYNAMLDAFVDKAQWDSYVFKNCYMVHCHQDRLNIDLDKGQRGLLVRPIGALNIICNPSTPTL